MSIMREESGTPSRTFLCSCGKIFLHKSSFSRHRKECKKNTKTSHIGYKCDRCHKTFSRKDNKVIHQKSCEKKKKNQGFCQICNKDFKYQYYLKRHLVVHERSLLKCSYCDQEYKLASHFYTHLYTVHPEEENDCQLSPAFNDILFGIGESVVLNYLTYSNQPPENPLVQQDAFTSNEDSYLYVPIPDHHDESVEFDNESPNSVSCTGTSHDKLGTTSHSSNSSVKFDNSNGAKVESVPSIAHLNSNGDKDSITMPSISSIESESQSPNEASPTNSGDTPPLNDNTGPKVFYRRKRRQLNKVSDDICEMIHSEHVDISDHAEIIKLVIKKLELKQANLMNKQRSLGLYSDLDKRTSCWEFWHSVTTPSTLTSRPALLKVGTRPRIQCDLEFPSPGVEQVTNKRGVRSYQACWRIVEQPYLSLYHMYKSKHHENFLSYGSFLSLKPFYVRQADNKDREMCLCKVHLKARSSIECLLQNMDQQGYSHPEVTDYDSFFKYLYNNCPNVVDEDAYVP